MFSNARSRICANGQLSKEFEVIVSVQLGCIISPLLFIIVLEILYHILFIQVPLELLNTDDLVIVTEPLKEYVEKFKNWKTGLQ